MRDSFEASALNEREGGEGVRRPSHALSSRFLQRRRRRFGPWQQNTITCPETKLSGIARGSDVLSRAPADAVLTASFPPFVPSRGAAAEPEAMWARLVSAGGAAPSTTGSPYGVQLALTRITSSYDAPKCSSRRRRCRVFPGDDSGSPPPQTEVRRSSRVRAKQR